MLPDSRLQQRTHLSSNDKASWEVVILSHFTQHLKSLKGQLPGGGYDQNSQSICWSPLKAVQEFQSLKKGKKKISLIIKNSEEKYVTTRSVIEKDDALLIQIMNSNNEEISACISHGLITYEFWWYWYLLNKRSLVIRFCENQQVHLEGRRLVWP